MNSNILKISLFSASIIAGGFCGLDECIDAPTINLYTTYKAATIQTPSILITAPQFNQFDQFEQTQDECIELPDDDLLYSLVSKLTTNSESLQGEFRTVIEEKFWDLVL